MALLPTFSPAGNVSNPLEVIDYMMAHFFLTQKSQTFFFKDKLNVMSYQSLIADAPNQGQLAKSIESYLGDYLSTQFDNVQLGVQINQATDEPNSNKLTVVIGCTFESNGQAYTLSHAIDLLGTQVQRVYRLNNTGSPT